MNELIEVVRRGELATLHQAMHQFSEENRLRLVNEIDEQGQTLLHVASEGGHLEVVRYLLGLEARMDIKDKNKKTSYDLACAADHVAVATLLKVRIDWVNQYGKQLSLNRALTLINEAYQSIAHDQDKHLILTLGETGVGKSTLINYLNGADYRLEGIPAFDLRTVLVAGKEIARVGHNPLVSETLYPQVLTLNTGTDLLNIADLSGINGTRESVLELVGTLSTHLISKMTSGVKGILFVIDCASLNAGKGGAFRQTIKTLSKILQGNFESEITDSVFFAITKLPAGVTIDGVIERFLQPAKKQLAKLVAAGGLDEEDKAMYLTLDLMLNARERIFLPNVCDTGTCRQRMLTALSSSPVIPKDCLDLLHVDRHQETFMGLLNFFSHEYTIRSHKIHEKASEGLKRFHQSVEKHHERILNWQVEIDELRRKLSAEITPNEAVEIVRQRQQSLREIQTQLDEKVREQERLKLRVEASQETLEALDSDVAVEYGNPYRFHHIGELNITPGDNPNWLKSFFGVQGDQPRIEKKAGVGNYVFENATTPTPGEIKDLVCSSEGGSFVERRIRNTRFSVNYTYPLGDNVFSEVRTKIAKRDVPENKMRIQQLQLSIATSIERLRELEQEMMALSQQHEAISNEIYRLQERGIQAAVLMENIKSQVRQREEWIDNAHHLIVSKEAESANLIQETNQLQLELDTNDDIFKTVVAIIRLLKLDNASNEILFNFVESYTHHSSKGGQDHFSNRHLVTGGKEMYKEQEAELRCPITSQFMYDPVDAADGYTYERQAIERWQSLSLVSPMTKSEFKHRDLKSNPDKKREVDAYLNRFPELRKDLYVPNSVNFQSQVNSKGGINMSQDNQELNQTVGRIATQSASTIVHEEGKSDKPVDAKTKLIIEKLKRLNLMPESAEKRAGQLSAYLELKNAGVNHISELNVELTDSFLQENIDLLKRLLKMEELNSSSFDSHLRDAERKLSNSEWNAAYHEIQAIYHELVSFDISDLQYYIEEGRKSAAKVKEKDIVFLYGRTGVGKSTTVHFLAGTKLEQNKGENYIQPLHIRNDALRDIVTSMDIGKSQTRFITAVPINCRELGGIYDEELVLCDAPGLNDLGGPEVDVANSVNVIRAIQSCKSVKLLILFSQRSIGDRGEGIREIAHLLSNMVENIKRHTPSFLYAFTNFEKHESGRIHDLLKRLLMEAKDEQYADANYIAILEDLVYRTRSEATILKPTQDEPGSMLDQLCRIEAIGSRPGAGRPATIFRPSITVDSMNHMRRQASKHQESLHAVIKLDEYDLAEYRLQNLRWLSENFPQQGNFEGTYKASLMILVGKMAELNEEGMKLLDRCFLDKNALTIIEVERIYQILKKLENIENVLAKHADMGMPESMSRRLHETIYEKARELVENFNDSEKNMAEKSSLNGAPLLVSPKQSPRQHADANQQISDMRPFNILDEQIVADRLDKIKLLSTKFEKLNLIYDKARDDVGKRIGGLTRNAKDLLAKNQFDTLAVVLSRLKRSTVVLKAHATVSESEEFCHTVGEKLYANLNSKITVLEVILEKGRLEQDDINRANEILNIFDVIKNSLGMRDHINMKTVEDIQEELLQVIASHFNKILGMIQEACKESGQRTFSQIKPYFEQMRWLRNNPAVAQKTASDYYRAVDIFSHYMRKTQAAAEKMLEKLTIKDAVIDSNYYTPIARCLSNLRDAAWIDSIRPGVYEEISREIKEELIYKISELNQRSTALSLGLHQTNNLIEAADILRRIQYMEKLDRFVEGLNKSRMEAVSQVKKKVDTTLNKLKVDYNLDRLDPETYVKQSKTTLAFLQTLQSQIAQLPSASTVFLKKNQFDSAEDLEKVIKAKEEEAKTFEERRSTLNKAISERLVPLKKAGLEYERTRSERILDGVGCDTAEELVNKIKEEEQKIDRNNEKFDRLNMEVVKLNQIKEEYLAKKESMIPSEAVQTILLENKFSSLYELDQAIASAKSDVFQGERNSAGLIFDCLEFNHYKQACNYLVVCEDHVPEIQPSATDIKISILNYAKNYSRVLEEQFDKSFKCLERIQDDNDVIVHVDVLRKCFEKLHDATKAEGIEWPFSKKEISVIWKGKLRTLRNQLDDKMRTLLAEKAYEQLRRLLNVISGLSWLDDHALENQKFNTVFDKYIKLYHEQIATAGSEISELLKRFEYRRVSEWLGKLNSEQNHKIVIGEVEDHIKQHIGSAQMLLNTMDLLVEGTAGNVQQKLKKLKDAEQYLSNQLDPANSQELKEFLEKSKKHLTEKIEKMIQEIQSLDETHDFSMAKKQLKSLQDAFGYLREFSEKEILEKTIKGIEDSLRNASNRVMEKYKRMSISEYSSNPPNLISNQLSGQTQLGFDILIREKIEMEISRIMRSSALVGDAKLELRQINGILDVVPESQKRQLNKQLEAAEDELNNQTTAREAEISNAVDSDNIKRIKELLDFYKLNASSQWSNRLKFRVIEKFQNRLAFVEFWLKENTEIRADVLEALVIVYKFHQAFSDEILKGQLDIYNQFQMKFNDKLNVGHQTLLAFIQCSSANNFNVITAKQKQESINYLDAIYKVLDRIQDTGILPSNFIQRTMIDERISKLLAEIINDYKAGLKNLTNSDLKQAIDKLKFYAMVISKLQQCGSIPTFSSYAPHMIKYINVMPDLQLMENEICETIVDELTTLSESKLLCDKTKGLEKNRNDFYRTLEEKILKLDALTQLVKTNFISQTESRKLTQIMSLREKVIHHLFAQIDDMVKVAGGYFNTVMKKSDYEKFNLILENLYSLLVNVKSLFQKTEDAYNKVKDHVLQSIDSIVLDAKNKLRDTGEFAKCLIKIKGVSENILLLKTDIDMIIEELLKDYKAAQPKDTTAIAKLGAELNNNRDNEAIAQAILSEHKYFKGYAVGLFNDATQKHGIDYVLGTNDENEYNMGYDSEDKQIFIDRESLRESYKKFDDRYKLLVRTNLSSKSPDIDSVKNKVLQQVSELNKRFPQRKEAIQWPHELTIEIPELLAGVFAIWTLSNAEHFFDSEESKRSGVEGSKYLLKPHAAQVIAIFRMLGIGHKIKENPSPATAMAVSVLTLGLKNLDTKPKQKLAPLFNNLVQIGTGEGKSVTLAMTATILALLGMDVSIACYSDYLSQRDFNEFKAVFTTLGLLGNDHASASQDQVGSAGQGYIRHAVSGDGECGYTAFGITRAQALLLLIDNLNDVRDILQPAVKELLLTEEFYKYLIENKHLATTFTHQMIIDNLIQHGNNLNVLQACLHYDVRDKKRDAGWPHPCVLQALAHIQRLGLRIWRLGEQAQLVPHRGSLFDYAEYAHGHVAEWIDLLFVNGNHFERLEIVGEIATLSKDGVYPLNSSQSLYYGTFNELCERLVNESGDIRERITHFVSGNDIKSKASVLNHKPKILLVDEVDVFFSKDFYGNVYSPSTFLKHDTVKKLIDYAWKNRRADLTLKMLQETSEYKNTVDHFKGWSPLIDEMIKSMLHDLKTFEKHEYIVHGDKIGYKDQDTVLFNVTHGYKTLFAYYHEHEKNPDKITQTSLNEHIGFVVNCASFSYAEIPNKFDRIMGVSGTLRTLTEPERSLIRKDFKIDIFTYMPSVFGKNNLKFEAKEDIKIETEVDYFNRIRQEINSRQTSTHSEGKPRPVFVFFESRKKLIEFLESPALTDLRSDINIMTEELSYREKITAVKNAVSRGQITLITRIFGRGTDFVCRDELVKSNGGVHVIQTFLSPEVSEETQIKGRTARQGAQGSYSMVLLDKDLEKFLISAKEIKEMSSKDFYSRLDSARRDFFVKHYDDDKQFVKLAKEEHDKSIGLLQDLNSNNLPSLRTYLITKNKGPAEIIKSRTICLMDATGSMSHLLHNAKNTVGTMFERATDILKDHGMPSGSFQLKFSVYRNYDSPQDKILESSNWETKADELRKFMDQISPTGGWGNEAIEIGLWHVNKVAETDAVSQVILIGDAAANTDAEITQKRNDEFGEAYWKQSKFGEKTSYQAELARLKDKKILVHTFFVDKRAEANFKEIASAIPGSKCEKLEINSPNGAEMLTNFVTQEILRSSGGSEQGEKLVEAYKAKFVKTFSK